VSAKRGFGCRTELFIEPISNETDRLDSSTADQFKAIKIESVAISGDEEISVKTPDPVMIG